MTVRETVLLAAKILGIDEGVNAYFDGESNEMQAQAERLLSAFHLAECSLALDYIPLHAEDEVYAMSGRVDFSALENSSNILHLFTPNKKCKSPSFLCPQTTI